MIASLGGSRVVYLMRPEWFRTIIVSSNIWQGIGWGSIIYLAALSSIDQEIYQAAKIDGANRWKQMWYVTLPGIAPTIVIMLILRMGHLLSVGYEKILLLYIPNTYETGDVIGTYVYRTGIQQAAYGYSTAVGLFNSVVNLAFLMATNWISKRFSENSLW
jgi:putative aldouronate transport system permease protein